MNKITESYLDYIQSEKYTIKSAIKATGKSVATMAKGTSKAALSAVTLPYKVAKGVGRAAEKSGEIYYKRKKRIRDRKIAKKRRAEARKKFVGKLKSAKAKVSKHAPKAVAVGLAGIAAHQLYKKYKQYKKGKDSEKNEE